MTRIDLHAHTTHSDGTCSPEALAEEARRVGLSGIAVTDHDTTTAIAPVRRAAADYGIQVFDGCEISTRLPSGIVHVLAYGFDPEHERLQSFLEGVRDARDARNKIILAKLNDLGLTLTMDEVMQHVVGSVVARPHFAMALVKRGHADSLSEVFERWLHDRGPAYVVADMPDPTEAMAVVRAAGGVTVIAHPKQMRLGGLNTYRRTFERFRDAGLTGIEVDHPSHDASHRKNFRLIAGELDLVPTGGSDFHGDAKPHIRLGEGDGSIEVHYDTWTALMERRPA